MKKPAEPELPAASNVIPIAARVAAPAPPRERSWRNLVRRLEKNPLPAPGTGGKR